MSFVQVCRRLSLSLVIGVIALVALPARAAAPLPMKRIALVVGANDPPAGRAALRFAHDDAADLADVLRRVGGFAPGDVHVLLDPHPRELLAAFDGAARFATGASGDVLFVFYYSGHSDGQSLFPHGEKIALAELRARVERVGARIRIGILDTCRGGSWTQSKGLTVGPPLSMADLMNVDTEGTALVSSSSGLENAHEAADVHGSFFTHYFAAGLRGAADRAGDGNVTLEEAFDYAKERTVRDSARLAKTPQHPSFDLALRGRQDIVLSVLSPGTSALQITGARASIEVIHLPSGVTVADAPAGPAPFRIAVAPGHYLVRSVVDGRVYAKEVDVRAGETATLAEGQLEATGNEQLAMKGSEAKDSDDADSDAADRADAPPKAPATDKKPASDDPDEIPRQWRFAHCNEPHAEGGTVRTSTGCAGVFGFRGSVVGASGASSRQLAGLEISADAEEYWRRGIFSSRSQYRAALGGGGAGLEGALFGAAAFGFRAPVTEHQGPVVRAGAVGYVLGNDAFYSSLIELPQLQLGWQWSQGHAVVEAAATSGVILTGRFRSQDAQTRDVGTGFAYGGHVSLQVPWIRLSAMAERLPGDDGLDTVDMAMGSLCAVAAPVAICADGLVEQSHARVASGAEPFVRTTYAGVTIGLTGER